MKQPPNGIARNREQARVEANKIGYPVLVRPSFVLGGRAMEICYDQFQLDQFALEAFAVAEGKPVLIDKFLEDATAVDVDSICDGQRTIVAGVMEHIEEAGVHSGDSACAIPPYSLPGPVVEEIKQATQSLAAGLQVRGLMNVQYAIKMIEGRYTLYVLEVNPRASRTAPFVSKAVGLPIAKIAAKVMAGMTLDELGVMSDPVPGYVSVKESVFPFAKFAGVDIILGPEMRSTGEVMGMSDRFSIAFAKSQVAAGVQLPTPGSRIFVSVSQRDKHSIIDSARRLSKLGYLLMATSGTARELQNAGIEVERVNKLKEGHPNLIDHLINGNVQLIINTPSGKGARTDEGHIRAKAVAHGVSCITTMQAIQAVVKALDALQEEDMNVRSLQDRLADR